MAFVRRRDGVRWSCTTFQRSEACYGENDVDKVLVWRFQGFEESDISEAYEDRNSQV
jgi:hypothetical protein